MFCGVPHGTAVRLMHRFELDELGVGLDGNVANPRPKVLADGGYDVTFADDVAIGIIGLGDTTH